MYLTRKTTKIQKDIVDKLNVALELYIFKSTNVIVWKVFKMHYTRDKWLPFPSAFFVQILKVLIPPLCPEWPRILDLALKILIFNVNFFFNISELF